LPKAQACHIGPGGVLEFLKKWLKLFIRISTALNQLNQLKNRLPQLLLAKNAVVAHYAGVL
jgi:hypothetical protein